jgi:hypothetical protein
VDLVQQDDADRRVLLDLQLDERERLLERGEESSRDLLGLRG